MTPAQAAALNLYYGNSPHFTEDTKEEGMRRPKWLRDALLKLAGYNPASVLDVSTEEGLAVAGAMRGPDDANFLSWFKFLLTARIRHWKGINWRTCDVRNKPPTVGQLHKLEYPVLLFAGRQDELERATLSAAYHYFSHICSALGRIDVPMKDRAERDVLFRFSDRMAVITSPLPPENGIELAQKALDELKEFYLGDSDDDGN